MTKKQIFRCFAAALLCLTLAAPCLLHSAQGAEIEYCSLQINYAPDDRPMAGVTFRIYRVADIDQETATYDPAGIYASYRVLTAPGSWEARAATLAAYVDRDQLPADKEGETDTDGRLDFGNLPSGLYLITGDSASREGTRYTPMPILLSLPHMELTEDGYIWTDNVSIYAKYTRTTPGDSTVQRRVIKVWEDEGSEDVRPDQVTVDLLQDGAVYDTAVLSAENNWRFDWTGLPSGFNYQVAERSPGEDYAVLVSQTGITFVITNTYGEEILDDNPPLVDQPDLPPDDKDPEEIDIEDENPPLADLPQTGQLWWPVPVLAVTGGMMLLLGGVQRRKSAHEEEE